MIEGVDLEAAGSVIVTFTVTATNFLALSAEVTAQVEVTDPTRTPATPANTSRNSQTLKTGRVP